jgi:hypothetical protein
MTEVIYPGEEDPDNTIPPQLLALLDRAGAQALREEPTDGSAHPMSDARRPLAIAEQGTGKVPQSRSQEGCCDTAARLPASSAGSSSIVPKAKSQGKAKASQDNKGRNKTQLSAEAIVARQQEEWDAAVKANTWPSKNEAVRVSRALHEAQGQNVNAAVIASQALYEVRQEKVDAAGWHTSIYPFRNLDPSAGSSMDREPSNKEKEKEKRMSPGQR